MKNRTRIFITGATGFVGSHLARKCIQEKFETHILVRDRSSISRIKDIESKLFKHYADLLQVKQLINLMKKIRPQYIFHLANRGLYGGVESNPKKVFETKAEAKQEVFDFITSWYNTKRIHSSLGYVSPKQFEDNFEALAS